MNCTSVSLLVLVIFCCRNFISAADVCEKSASSSGTITPNPGRGTCTQFCFMNDVTCDFSCNYTDCAQSCLAGTCALSCFDGNICSQTCKTATCSKLSCQADTCIQKCEGSKKCSNMKCNATKK